MHVSTMNSLPTTTRVHIALDVRDVEASLPFYETLFGQRPTKVRDGYAKFEVADLLRARDAHVAR
jgi:catechol 2,3-dioxygenase-like lactoylglutathione lyase family enzyme